MSTDDYRPPKRARQACDPCRRKKSRCPGERPVCSYCDRLGQQCVYSDSGELGPGATEMARRLENVEGRLEELISSLRGYSSSRQTMTPVTVQIESGSRDEHAGDTRRDLDNQSSISRAAQLYLSFCNYQPLPLFDPEDFIETIATRDPELILAIKAISLRFEREVEVAEARILEYAKNARSTVMDRINNGNLELSTLQTLCLLAMFEFSVGHTIQAGLTLNMAAYLAQSVNINGEVLTNIQTDADEKRRCSWSIYMLQHLQGDGIQTSRLISGVRTPFNTGSGLSPKYTPPSIREPRGSNTKEDLGLVSYTIQLSEVWALAMNYAATKVDPVSLPPWFPESDYSVVSFRHTEFDSLVPLKYRYHAENLQNHSLQELNERRDFWGPWLFVQIMFEAIPCLLNHPFLLSMRLRSFRHTMPHSFIRQSFENITLHASWILHIIDLVEHKGFEICDPILAHCVVIVATIHLQHSFVDDQGLRDTARNGYNKCVRFLQPLGERWPHVRNMMQKLHRLREGVSASTNSQSWSNNAKLLWELLVYDRASSSQSSGDFFGATLSDPNAKHTSSRFMTPDPDFPLVGSAGISGHKTVAKEVVAYPPESVSTPPASFTSGPDMHQAPSAEPFGLIGTPAEGMLNDNLFLEPESYGRAIEDWWNFTSS
ncbi:putative Zn(II)2Cys6 transcription factor [Aspergillus tamarii]|uniref:Putative Zn(II)2Cys6 transcription factor n=1 Tax=Aspergillus tamarii TaxID=41984 RepID=A0A5N6V187_ASPTM|nr:putative Zn(II)2Cys6 transcription factor [Aspergillus tamarii]